MDICSVGGVRHSQGMLTANLCGCMVGYDSSARRAQDSLADDFGPPLPLCGVDMFLYRICLCGADPCVFPWCPI